jgi:hypothetical protein
VELHKFIWEQHLSPVRVAQVLSLPEADAWSLMEHYKPSEIESDGIAVGDRAGEGLDEGGSGTDYPDLDSYQLPREGGAGDKESLPMPTDSAVEAASPDDDDCIYEDMELLSVPPKDQGRGSVFVPDLAVPTAPSSGGGSGGRDRWRELRLRLLHLGSQLSYTALAHPSVWRSPPSVGALPRPCIRTQAPRSIIRPGGLRLNSYPDPVPPT